jgi:hypothetical protein
MGKLSVNTGCKGYSTSALLQTTFTVTNNSSLKVGDLLTQIHLQYDCCKELGVKRNVSNLPLDMKFKQTVSHLEDLKYASFKVAELDKEIKEQEWKNHHVNNHTSYSTIVYVILVVSVMYISYKLYVFLKSRWQHTGRPRALMAQVRELKTSTETRGSGNTVNINIKTSNESLAINPEAIQLRSSTSSKSLQVEPSPRRSLRPRPTKSYF